MSGRARTAALGIGLVGGFASGLLGVGGGTVFVPGLVLLAGLAQRRAQATSLAAILPVGLVGAIVYATSGGRVHVGLAALLAVGGVIGAPLGVRALSRIPDEPLRLAFAAVVAVAGVRLVIG